MADVGQRHSLPVGFSLPPQGEVDRPPPLQRRNTELLVVRSPQSRQSIEKEISNQYGQAALNYAKAKLKSHDQTTRASGGIPLGPSDRKPFLTARAKEARDAAMGLSGLRRGDGAFNLGQTVGKSAYAKGGTVGQGDGTFITVKQKDVGRDPGQLAKLNWTPQDQLGLRDLNHPYSQIRANLVAGFNRGDQQAVTLATGAMEDMIKADPAWQNKMNSFLSQQRQAGQAPAARDMLTHILGTLNPRERQAFDDLMAKKHIMATDPKFSDIHMIKGDYAEADITRGKVRISKELARASSPRARKPTNRGSRALATISAS